MFQYPVEFTVRLIPPASGFTPLSGVTMLWPRIDLIGQRFEDAFLQLQNRWRYFGRQLAHRAYVPTSLVTLRKSPAEAKVGDKEEKSWCGGGASLPMFVPCVS